MPRLGGQGGPESMWLCSWTTGQKRPVHLAARRSVSTPQVLFWCRASNTGSIERSMSSDTIPEETSEAENAQEVEQASSFFLLVFDRVFAVKLHVVT